MCVEKLLRQLLCEIHHGEQYTEDHGLETSVEEAIGIIRLERKDREWLLQHGLTCPQVATGIFH